MKPSLTVAYAVQTFRVMPLKAGQFYPIDHASMGYDASLLLAIFGISHVVI
jgi:hypothetical protein